MIKRFTFLFNQVDTLAKFLSELVTILSNRLFKDILADLILPDSTSVSHSQLLHTLSMGVLGS